MKKDTVYIDTEDDITSIIEKVKNSEEKIIALVPPKRVGVLQSAVNLKLLHKAATTAHKRIVLITSNKSLGSLAAAAEIPVAKTLQSRPELLGKDAPDTDDDDVIDGSELPVGEHAKSAAKPVKDEDTNEEEIVLPADLEAATSPKEKHKPPTKKPKVSVPNFDTFRKKLFLGIGALVLFIIFLFWANVIAPHATVNIQAKTEDVDLSIPIVLKADTPTDIKQKMLQPVSQQVKKTNSTEFTATGKKDVGDKASGTMTITRDGVSDSTTTIPAGTGFSSGNYTFVTTSSVQVPASRIVGNKIDYGTATVGVSAAAVGDDYNLSSRSYQSTVEGYTARGSDMTGGSKRQITVVSASDVQAAQQKVSAQDQEAVKKELTVKFANTDTTVLKDTFTAVAGNPSVTPAVDSEASKGQVTVETTYTLYALKKSDVKKVLDAYINEKLKGKKNQQIYDNGQEKLQFTKYVAEGGSLVLDGTGYTGPKIDTNALKPQLVGKNYEDIRQHVKKIEGVQDVDTNFSPFWVSSVSSKDKIDIKFKIDKK